MAESLGEKLFHFGMTKNFESSPLEQLTISYHTTFFTMDGVSHNLGVSHDEESDRKIQPILSLQIGILIEDCPSSRGNIAIPHATVRAHRISKAGEQASITTDHGVVADPCVNRSIR